MNPDIIKVRYKGQVTIPQYLREKLDISEGDYLSCELHGDRILIRKASAFRQASYDDGIWKLIGTAEDKEGRKDVSTNKHKYLGNKP